MMILRNALKSNMRARGRTFLFTALIALLTAMLTLSVGVKIYCSGAVDASDSSFRTVAMLEYLGDDYPDQTVGDPGARKALADLDISSALAIDGVEEWHPQKSVYASLDGFENKNGNSIYLDYGVIKAFFLMERFSRNIETEIEGEPQDEEYIVFNYSIENAGEEWFSSVTVKMNGEVRTYDHYFKYMSWISMFGDAEFYYKGTGEYIDINTSESLKYSDLPAIDSIIISNLYTMHPVYKTAGYNAVDNPAGLPVYCHYDSILSFSETGEVSTHSGYKRREKEDFAYKAICDVMYGYEKSGGMVLQIFDSARRLKMEDGKAYYIHGRFGDGSSGIKTFYVSDFGDTDALPYAEANGEDDAEVKEIFSAHALKYKAVNAHVELIQSDSVRDLYPFHQGHISILRGRFTQPGESGACVVSYDIASAMELELGSEIDLRKIDGSDSSREDMTGIGEPETYKVVGITTSSPDYSGTVWIARDDAEYKFYGYDLGAFLLDNSKGREAFEKLQALLPEHVRAALFDQGYESAIKPFRAIENTAFAAMLASAAGALAVILLFSYLFIGRQGETVGILHALGTPKRKIAGWMLSGTVFVSAFASAAGAAAGTLLIPRLVMLVRKKAEADYVAAPPYSDLSIGAVKQTRLLHVESSVLPGVAIALATVLLAVLFSAVFLAYAVRGSHNKRGKTGVRIPAGKTTVFGKGAARFAAVSAMRGGLRTFAVPVVAAAMTVIIIVLSSITSNWEKERERAFENTTISGSVTSLNGRLTSGISISDSEVRAISAIGGITNVCVSKGYDYWLPDEMPSFSSSQFGMELREAWIGKQPDVVALNSLFAAKEFFYNPPVVTWAEGYDESVFAASGKNSDPFRDPEGYPALVADSYAESHGLAFGDDHEVYIKYDGMEVATALHIIGTYRQTGLKNNIYVPLYAYADPREIKDTGSGSEPEDEKQVWVETEYGKILVLERTQKYFSVCRFTLESAAQLESVRGEFLREEYSWPNNVRSKRLALVLYDSDFLARIETLEKSMAFGKAVYPLVFALVAVLGFIVSWLMINGRKQEFAYMRGFGAKRTRVFMSFFTEQALLALAGCAAGLAALAFTSADGAALARVGIFLLCYMAGCAVSVLVIGRMKLMDLLSERD